MFRIKCGITAWAKKPTLRDFAICLIHVNGLPCSILIVMMNKNKTFRGILVCHKAVKKEENVIY